MTERQKITLIRLFLIAVAVGGVAYLARMILVTDTINISVDPARSFTVAVISDTQHYAAGNPDIFCKMTSWIASEKRSLNIVFVAHIGDIVEDGGTVTDEWRSASKCMNKLGSIPYTVNPGNHDTQIVNVHASGWNTYNQYFPAAEFAKESWYGGNFEGNQNSYQIVKVPSLTLLFLNLELEPPSDVLDWANTIVRKVRNQYPNVYAVLSTHKYMEDNKNEPDSKVHFGSNGNSGDAVWDELIQNNCAIGMVLSGHYSNLDGENEFDTSNGCGRPVHQILANYENRENGGNGYLRIYVFTPSEKKIEAYTYSPITKTFENDQDSRFTLTF